MKLSYKTRANSSPQGKRKVFFCCHPDDFDLFFDEITDEILQINDCAIFYDSDPSGEYEESELHSQLGYMQLLVIPVTAKFLLLENRALSVEFAFAKKSHIPVLPLMQEDGLVDSFNQMCGNIQFLDKHLIDATGIPYKQKLERFLESALLGGEIIQKVREAFDAYVFLSYRKKDRLYARRLMEMIHANDFARDLAIWYDEFLVPGEDFNDAILTALDKSILFALVMTPNVVIEDNYVKDIEYPMAKKAGKPVLAAEMLETQRQLVEGMLDSRDAIVWSAEEKELFARVLRALLSSISLRTNSSPVHDYYIGLAYLYGIDVETDHKMAILLIQNAADQNVTDAWETLSNIYAHGIGVDTDFNKAAECQEKYCDLLWQELQTQSSSDQLLQIDALSRLQELYKALGNRPQQLAVFDKIIKLCKLYADINQPDYSPVMHKQLLLSYFERYYLETHPGAIGTDTKENAEKRIAECVSFLDRNPDIDITLLLVRWYIETADLCDLLSRNLNSKVTDRDAYEWKIKSKELIEKIWFEDLNPQTKLLIAHSYNELGYVFMNHRGKEEAEQMFQKACEICEQCMTYSPAADSASLLQRCYSNLAQCKINNGDNVGAKKISDKIRGLLEVRVKASNSPTARFALATAYGNSGFLEQKANNMSGAKFYYEEAISTVERLHKDYPGHYSHSSLGFVYLQIGEYYSQTTDIETAMELCEKALQEFSLTSWDKYFYDSYGIVQKLYTIYSGFIHSEEERRKLSERYLNLSRYVRSSKWKIQAQKVSSMLVIPDTKVSCMKLALQEYLSSGGRFQSNYLIDILNALITRAYELSYLYIDTRDEYLCALYNYGRIDDNINVIYSDVLESLDDDRLESLRNLTAEHKDDTELVNKLNIKKEVYSRHCETKGESSPDTLSALYELAASYADIGDYPTSLMLYEKDYSLRRTVLGETHEDTLRTLNSLAVCYRKSGDFERAISILEDLLSKCSENLGQDHELTQECESNLAYSFRKLFEDTSLKFGIESQETLPVLIRLIDFFHTHSRKKAAIFYAKRLYNYLLSTNGIADALTLDALDKYTTGLEIKGAKETKKKVQEHACSLLKEALGRSVSSDRDTGQSLSSENSLSEEQEIAVLKVYAYLQSQLSRFTEETETRKTIYDLLCKSKGEKHPDTIQALADQANGAYYADQYKDALKLFQQAYKLQCELFGEGSEKALNSLYKISQCYTFLDNYYLSGKLEYEYYCKKEGTDSKNAARALHLWASSCFRHERYSEACELYQKAYEQRSKILGPDDPDTLRSLWFLGHSFRELEEYEKALVVYESHYSKRKSAMGEKHADTLLAREDIAYVLYVLQRYEEALEIEKEVYLLRSETIGENHSDTIRSLYNIGCDYEKIGNYVKAAELFEQAVKRFQQIGADGSETAIRSKKHLEECKKHLNEV